jgi:uncharacterized protein
VNSEQVSGRRRYDRWFATPKTVVLQPTSWCNLDCSYCYLPLRHLRNRMPVAVAQAVAASVASLTEASGSIDVVWHGGEPLAVGREAFAALLRPFERLRVDGRIQHYVQTNGTLLTGEWCELLSTHDVRVGVSIDGPEALSGRRVDLRGRPAFQRIMRGVSQLRRHGIPFSVIAVVGSHGIERPEEMLEFLATLGCHSVGLNLEEAEGVNLDPEQPAVPAAVNFWRRTLLWVHAHPGVVAVREVDRLTEYLRLMRNGGRRDWERQRLDPIPTVSCKGDVVLLSPELADTPDADHRDFVAGNVLTQSLPAILDVAHRIRYVQDFLTGLERCQAECLFFDFCRGAQAANRYFENGSLATTETRYCQVSRQALVTALSSLSETKEPL